MSASPERQNSTPLNPRTKEPWTLATQPSASQNLCTKQPKTPATQHRRTLDPHDPKTMCQWPRTHAAPIPCFGKNTHAPILCANEPWIPAPTIPASLNPSATKPSCRRTPKTPHSQTLKPLRRTPEHPSPNIEFCAYKLSCRWPWTSAPLNLTPFDPTRH